MAEWMVFPRMQLRRMNRHWTAGMRPAAASPDGILEDQEPVPMESGSLFSLSRSTRAAAGPPVPKESRSIGSLSPSNREAG